LDKLGAKKIKIKSRADISWLCRVAREIDRYKPDLLMSHGFNGHFVGIATRIFAKKRIPMICSYHGKYHATTPVRSLLAPAFNALTELFMRNYAISIVAVAEYTKNYLVEHGTDKKKITVIHNGIEDKIPDASARDRIRREWEIEKNELVIGAASRLDPVKGISYLVDAFAQISRRLSELKLVIIGTGTLDNALRRQVQEKGVKERVILTGFRTDIDDCLVAVDIFALPSLAEYHSFALLEAMRLAKAIIATDVGGNTESVRHEEEALIVPARDTKSLAHAIERLARSASLRQALGLAAQERFKQNFTVDEMVGRTAEWLIECGRLAKANSVAL
jgi:glycosyltransferase involved in cell wall biosynthesis